MNYETWIGKKVKKKSGKPFKSGKKWATVSGITNNPHVNRQAFTFQEDDSVVNCEICELKR